MRMTYADNMTILHVAKHSLCSISQTWGIHREQMFWSLRIRCASWLTLVLLHNLNRAWTLRLLWAHRIGWRRRSSKWRISQRQRTYGLLVVPYWRYASRLCSVFTTNSDLWWYWKLVTGSPPYHGMGAMNAMYHILEDPHPPIPESVSDELRDFLLSCFDKDPRLRKSAKELSEHPWILKHGRHIEQQVSVGPKERRIVASSLLIFSFCWQTFEDHKKQLISINREASAETGVKADDIASMMLIRGRNDEISVR